VPRTMFALCLRSTLKDQKPLIIAPSVSCRTGNTVSEMCSFVKVKTRPLTLCVKVEVLVLYHAGPCRLDLCGTDATALEIVGTPNYGPSGTLRREPVKEICPLVEVVADPK